MITFITPVAPEHQGLLAHAFASVQSQTIECKHLIAIDHDRRGPGAIRNELLAQVETDQVAFLDADDWIEPDYAERMTAALRDGYYVYCDWFQDGDHIKAPPYAWCAGTWHTVTSVVPTKLVRLIGGFDETLPGMEDTDFFLRLVTRNICGRRVPYPLMHYRAKGGRGQAINDSGEVNLIRQALNKKYGGIRMGCCGDMNISHSPTGVKQDGDILAQALWGGNREEHGRATGRHYPRLSYPKTTWVSPLDIAAAPSLWREVVDEPPPDLWDSFKVQGEGVDAFTGEMIKRGALREEPKPLVIPPPIATDAKPDFDKVKRLAKAKAKK